MLFCKDAEFEWKNEQEEAFNTLKEKITKEPVLRAPNFSKDWYILVDASKDGVLTQVALNLALPTRLSLVPILV